MVNRLTIELFSKEKITFQKASLFQGVLMEQINKDYANKMHEDGLHPYSQKLKYEGDKLIWQINTMNQEAYEEIILPLQKEEFNKIELKHNNLELAIKGKKISGISYQNMINKYYFGECSRYVRIRFTTPTSFKRAGNYVFYPDMSLIYNSLMNKYDTFAQGATIRTEEILEQLVEYSEIAKYNLRSVMFHMEGVRIPAFMGEVLVKIKGPQPLVNLIHLLLQYGTYSGVGIKTAMGMGALEIIENQKKEGSKV